MSFVTKILAGVAVATVIALAPNASMSGGGEAWAQSKPKKGCECMNFCKTGSGNKCIACRNKCS